MSEQQKSVKLGEIIQEFNLEILRTAPDYAGEDQGGHRISQQAVKPLPPLLRSQVA